MRSLACVCVLGAIAAGCAGKRFDATDRATITGLIDAQRQAWNRGDIEAFMAGYEQSEELVFTSGGTIRRGWKTTLERYRSRYGTDKASMGRLSFEVVDLRPLGADGAVVLGRWQLEGGARDAAGVFSLVLARTADGWKIVHDHTSVTATP